MKSEKEKQNEYWLNVSAQEEIPIWGNIELPDFDELNKILIKLSKSKDKKKIIIEALLKTPKIFNILRLFVGVADKRAYLDLSYIFRNTKHPINNTSLCGCEKTEMGAHQTGVFLNLLKTNNDELIRKSTVKKISEYLFEKGLVNILNILSQLNEVDRLEFIEKTIFPREVQQQQAKRRGHGAEAILAKVVKELGCKIIPPEKDTNPMGQRDTRLNKETFEIVAENNEGTRSYDLVVLDKNNKIRVLVIGLIHSSDPGQYGVDKAGTTKGTKNEITEFNKEKDDDEKIVLVALTDGVGFAENKKDTINIILKYVDDFVQIKTLYKIGLLLHKLGLCKIKAIRFDKFYSKEEIDEIKKEYIPNGIKIIKKQSETTSKVKVKAGLATLFI
jgi:hypothetical protein